MNKDLKKNVVPALRFPEFQDDDGWDEKKLGDVTYSLSKKNKEGIKLPIYSINNKEGFLPQSIQFEGMDSNHRGYDITLYKIVGKKTFAYNPARIDVGSIGYSGELDNIIISSLYVCFKTNELINDPFLLHFVKSNYFNQSVKKGVEGGIRNYLFYENFSIINILLPEIKEQQKIADCLSSVDDLITAQSEKIETLKKHKKGLMQQLFPTEGETVPQLRFPEFLEDEEWEVKPLSEISENLDYRRVPITEIDRVKGDVPYYGASGVIDYVKDFIFNDNLLCISEDGANLLARTYPIAFSISGKTWVNNHAHVLKFENNFIQVLTENYLNAINVEDFLTGIAQPKLNRGTLDIIPIPIPKPKEQKKIAECLTTIDDLIAAENEKLTTLKAHKKGLMQQLFPDTNEIE